MARSNMTRNDWLRVGVVGVVALVALYLLYPFWPLNEVVKLGLDLQGGVRLVLEAEGVADMTPADQTKTIEQVITILSNRIDQYGLANAEIRRFGGERILINLPGATDPEEARRLIGQTALLEFRRVVQAGTSPLDDLIPTSIDQEVLYDRDGISSRGIPSSPVPPSRMRSSGRRNPCRTWASSTSPFRSRNRERRSSPRSCGR